MISEACKIIQYMFLHYFLHVCICYFALICFLKQSKLLPTIIPLKGLPKGGRKTVVMHSAFYVHMFYCILFGKYVWRCFAGGRLYMDYETYKKEWGQADSKP